MIEALVRYVQERDGPPPAPGFKRDTIKWALDLARDGRLRLLPLGPDGTGDVFARCPEMSFQALKALKGHGAHFLVETAQVVALHLKAEAPATDVGKAHGKHTFFVRMLRDAARVMPGLAEAADALDDPAALEDARRQMAEARVKPTDRVTLFLGGRRLLEDETWHNWWLAFHTRILADRDKRSSAKPPSAADGQGEGRMVCLVTGNVVKPALTHPKIAGLGDVGGNSAGCVLVGYDKDAFPSYGLKQSQNGAMSAATAAAYREALNRLLLEQSAMLAGAKVVFWYRHAVPPDADPIRSAIKPPIDDDEAADQRDRLRSVEARALTQARQLLESLKEPAHADLRRNHYYALTLSGSGARVMVRDWAEGQFEDLAHAICRWFEHLAITNYRGTAPAKMPGIERVITSLLPPKPRQQRYADWVKPLGGERMAIWYAALNASGPIPHSAMARVVVEHHAFMQTGTLEDALKNGRDQAAVVSLLQARMALLKVYHVRKGETMDSKLNENHLHPAYHCGRVLAVVARLQAVALKDVNAGVVQRFYAAASATPALVLPRLVRNANFHLQQVRQRDPNRARWFQGQIAAIYGQIEDRLPPPLSLEDQSLFDLGYYHQMARDWPKGKSADGAAGEVSPDDVDADAVLSEEDETDE